MTTKTTFTGFLHALKVTPSKIRILIKDDLDRNLIGKQFLSPNEVATLMDELNCHDQTTGNELKYGCPLFKIDSSILSKYNLLQIAPRKQTIAAGKELLAEYFAESALKFNLSISVIEWAQDIPTDNIILCYEINNKRYRIPFTLEAVEDVPADSARQIKCKETIQDALVQHHKA